MSERHKLSDLWQVRVTRRNTCHDYLSYIETLETDVFCCLPWFVISYVDCGLCLQLPAKDMFICNNKPSVKQFIWITIYIYLCQGTYSIYSSTRRSCASRIRMTIYRITNIFSFSRHQLIIIVICRSLVFSERAGLKF